MDGRRWVLGRDWVAKVREPDNHGAPSLPLQADQQGLSAVLAVVVLTDSPPGDDKETRWGTVSTGSCPQGHGADLGSGVGIGRRAKELSTFCGADIGQRVISAPGAIQGSSAD